jgi:hypothetical protein
MKTAGRRAELAHGVSRPATGYLLTANCCFQGSNLMDAAAAFLHHLSAAERQQMAGLNSPAAIQTFLDELPYSTDDFYRCPRRVLRDGTAHCFDGALFGAAALRGLGYPPLILDMLAERDDEHLLALYKVAGHWGAVAKSNFAGLRFREPVYRSLRELVMSYFEDYFNADGEKTLRGYTVPLNLAAYDRLNWMTSDDPLERIADHTDRIRRFTLLTPPMVAGLSRVDERSYQAGMLGTNPAGLYRLAPREP